MIYWIIKDFVLLYLILCVILSLYNFPAVSPYVCAYVKDALGCRQKSASVLTY